jgi:hypothetical protein
MILDNSRYRYSVIIRTFNQGGQIEPDHMDIRPRLVRRLYSDNREYVVGSGDNWSRIAWKLLGNGRFFWVIADYSETVDVFTELREVEKLRVLTGLSILIANGDYVPSLTVDSVTGMKIGTKLRIENIAYGSTTSYDTVVTAVAEGQSPNIRVAPFTADSGALPVATTRISELYLHKPRLTVPTVQRTLFEATDFGNPLNTLVG